MPNRTFPIVTISHDPFARTELQRRTRTASESKFCAWCESWTYLARFCYRVSSDGDLSGNRALWSKPFCSIGCYRAYYN